ncbi:MAG: methylaspartate ammonia-lyase [Actinomycetota bacterium]|nr:methylaspartate ammonia-lyase [Actinomycetota bacterium]
MPRRTLPKDLVGVTHGWGLDSFSGQNFFNFYKEGEKYMPNWSNKSSKNSHIRVIGVTAVIGLAGFFCDDQSAIAKDATKDGFVYATPPVTPGFSATRMAGRGLSVILFGNDGAVGVGDLLTVQYGGVANREAPYSYDDLTKVKRFVETELSQFLTNQPIASFREASRMISELRTSGDLRSEQSVSIVGFDKAVTRPYDSEVRETANRRSLPTALRFAITSAILDLIANTNRELMATTIAREYQADTAFRRVSIFAQSGDDRYLNIDKMILKEVDALPHGLINNVSSLVGKDGSIFADYLRFVISRIEHLRPREDYRPTLHFDVYGTFGAAFGGSTSRLADYLASLKEISPTYDLRFEHPIDGGSFEGQIEVMARLKHLLRDKGVDIKIVADEWCNDVSDIAAFADADAADMIHIKSPDLGGLDEMAEATLAVKKKDLQAYLGGSCNESDVSARATTHLAVALGADQVLAKPGMGVDEGLMLVRNEMERIMAIAKFSPR